MRKRTLARELALQVLYGVDITHDDADLALENFWSAQREEKPDEAVINFANDLVRGVAQNIKAIDEAIVRYATNWKLERMAVVDRNIMRLASFELLFRQDIPPKVSINEAVELAKKYSGIEAAKFVNGILDKVKSEKP